jgi:hypothetical protein
MLKLVISRLFLFVVMALTAGPSFAADWWSMSDADFVTTYGKLATGSQVDQSQFAWMTFLRVNQPVVYQGDMKTYSQWELWPSDPDTFSPSSPPFKAANKFRPRPHLQVSKANAIVAMRTAAKTGIPQFNPAPASEEVTRNALSYGYIMKNKLNTQAGIAAFVKGGGVIDFPLGAVETKARWKRGAIDGAYQVAGYSLTGLHLMVKIAPTPKDPFTDNSPSWFWTTFEFKGNPGLANAQSLLTYHDVLPAAQITQLEAESGLSKSLFVNYVSNGQQIQFDDSSHPTILMGNTQLEDFAATPPGNPANWTVWQTSCHTCHSQASGVVDGNGMNFFFFTGPPYPTGPLTAADMPPSGSVSLDFVWALINAQ